MGFTKGQSGNPSGRPPGVGNKTTNKIREAFQVLMESNVDRMSEWLEQVADKDPKAALDLFIRMAEYTTPKLARVENSHEIDEGITEIKLNFVSPRN